MRPFCFQTAVVSQTTTSTAPNASARIASTKPRVTVVWSLFSGLARKFVAFEIWHLAFGIWHLEFLHLALAFEFCIYLQVSKKEVMLERVEMCPDSFRRR